MNQRKLFSASVLSACVMLAACGTPNYGNNASSYPASQSYPTSQSYPPSQPYPTSQSYPSSGTSATTAFGVVESIQAVNTGSSSGGINAGTVIGGVVGGLLGNQVGGGTGRGVATAAGVVGGAMAGNQIQKNTQAPSTAYQVGVRLDNGAFQTVMQDSVADLNVGSRVRLDNGRVYRY
ncbi:MAG: putative outer rane lipoprotein precursor SlyB-like [Herminiimonas sp.]|nr:putative outer rane lipoprotein precursor SlyB-like [Herminiimonas sp.]MDB5853747.1 putative outer rane lipoprotein precursor SlyB-like [Herminiimonas sp.]